MASPIAINGIRLDEVLMPMEPYDNRSVWSLSYPMSEIRLTRDNDRLCLAVPAYLAVELYRMCILPQDVNIPVEVSIGGRPAGRYLVSDVRYPSRCDSPFEQVTFTLTQVLQDQAPAAASARVSSHSRPKRTETYVIDITHYLDESGEVAQLPGPARKLASFTTLLIEAATSTSSADEHDSGIRCQGRGCQATIRTVLRPGEHEITWHCPLCGRNGVIRNWKNTKWNQRRRRKEDE